MAKVCAQCGHQFNKPLVIGSKCPVCEMIVVSIDMAQLGDKKVAYGE